MSKLLILGIIVFLVICGGATIITLYLTGVLGGKKCHKWSEEDKNSLKQTLKESLPFPDSALTCIVNTTSCNYSVEEVKNNKATDTSSVFGDCLGTKGNWKQFVKDEMKATMINDSKLKPECADCVLAEMEKTMSPLDTTAMSKTQIDDKIQMIVADCGSVCT